MRHALWVADPLRHSWPRHRSTLCTTHTPELLSGIGPQVILPTPRIQHRREQQGEDNGSQGKQEGHTSSVRGDP